MRAVRSVAEQTKRPYELILVNDCSQDDTDKILKNLQAKYGENWIKIINLSQNTGPACARNSGWDVATQPYVAFLDADDAWHPCKLEIQLKYMQAHPDIGITGHRWYWLREGHLAPRISERYTAGPIFQWQMLISNRLATPTVMLKRDIGFRFNPAKRHSEDYLLWLRIICAGAPAAFIDLDMTYLYKAPYGVGGMSGQIWAMEWGELDTYKRLFDEQLISMATAIALCALSIAKCVWRVTSLKLRLIR